MQAKVYKSTGSWYIVKTTEGKFYDARIKGVFKIDNIKSTNPLAVGDWVSIQTEDETKAIINKIHDRNNYVVRESTHNKNQQHIIASNLDQCLLFATITQPRTSQGFIDRFLVTCEAYHIPAIIVFNKIDIYKPKEQEQLKYFTEMYKKIGYTVLSISIKTQEGLAELQNHLQNKTTLLSGHSGVGKSSFLNYLLPQLQQRTQEISSWTGKGLHTTTFAEMMDLPTGGEVIDTPGIKEFGLINIEKQELSQYFKEMTKYLPECKFNNCSHLYEPQCAVKQAVANNEIDIKRYESYLGIYGNLA
jgi:ribosome biogenesis GTPase / thiamine phosphate phosphatase